MKSEKAGSIISETKTEVTNISLHGIWLYHLEKEYFLPYVKFPWFKSANIESILNVEALTQSHFHWPDLDIDIHLKSIEDPDAFPLVSKK